MNTLYIQNIYTHRIYPCIDTKISKPFLFYFFLKYTTFKKKNEKKNIEGWNNVNILYVKNLR